MGFFSKIGDGLKNITKQISLKNAVKIGTPLLGSIPVVGGIAQNVVSNMSQAHELKKEAENLANQGKLQEAQYAIKTAQTLSNSAGAGAVQVLAQNSNVRDILNGAVGQAGSTVIDSSIKAWFIKHWQKLALGLLGLVALIYALKKRGNRKSSR